MVDKSPNHLTERGALPFWLKISISSHTEETNKALLAMLQPEFDAIDSKRVRLQVTPTRNQLEFHLAAKDVKALRAASTSLLRLFMVAEGVLHLTMIQTSGEESHE